MGGQWDGGATHQDVQETIQKVCALSQFGFSGLDEPEPTRINELAISDELPGSLFGLCPALRERLKVNVPYLCTLQYLMLLFLHVVIRKEVQASLRNLKAQP